MYINFLYICMQFYIIRLCGTQSHVVSYRFGFTCVSYIESACDEYNLVWASSGFDPYDS